MSAPGNVTGVQPRARAGLAPCLARPLALSRAPFSALRRRPALLLAGALALIGAAWVAWGWCGDGNCGGAAFADPAWWRRQHALLASWQAGHPAAFLGGFVAVFALLSALSLPGCAPLCLVAGAVFGAWGGAAVLGGASTLGALASFLVARHVAREPAQRRHGRRLQSVQVLLARGGSLALFGLRLVPVVPFAVLNPLLGLTGLPLAPFVLSSLAGLTLGSLPYAWAGHWMAQRLASG